MSDPSSNYTASCVVKTGPLNSQEASQGLLGLIHRTLPCTGMCLGGAALLAFPSLPLCIFCPRIRADGEDAVRMKEWPFPFPGSTGVSLLALMFLQRHFLTVGLMGQGHFLPSALYLSV